jgi:hypothetical protein
LRWLNAEAKSINIERVVFFGDFLPRKCVMHKSNNVANFFVRVYEWHTIPTLHNHIARRTDSDCKTARRGIGKRSNEATGALTVVPSVSPVVYTPEEGVDAKWFASTGAGANVIVLEGVAAIPDSTDFSETVYVPTASESDRTATRERETSDSAKQ